ncbi:MAG: hypothetical protein EA395_05015 [Phormidium sp. GEM2.Bin31]|nr:MAG: hypothetical protein EA395_05015 [Phormidium sp. GEM2.Bin31]
MEPDSLPTELILSESTKSLGRVYLDWTPQPGHYLDVKQQTYKVLERRHRYQLKSGRYRLHQVALYVQTAQRPEEMTCVEGRWLIGDLSCRYNAHSELMRCAINPQGPCAGCRHYEPVDELA